MSCIARNLRPLALSVQHNQFPHARSEVTPKPLYSPTMIHTRRARQNTRLVVYLTFLNWYKWTLSRPDINLPSPPFSSQNGECEWRLATYLSRAPNLDAVLREDHLGVRVQFRRARDRDCQKMYPHLPPMC